MRDLDTIHHSAIIKSGVCMNTVTLSKEYQINFPKEIFQPIGCEAGTSFEVITYANKVELVPIKRRKSLRGIFKGMDTAFEREEEDRL
jgi:bifunctional DNA-binding transcriptional regulator/antitoxin component of YhaV-PrlF toxin-antitoxin module